MKNILMNVPMAKATGDGSKTNTRRCAINVKAIAKKYIGQNATGDTPSFEMAEKGQKLIVTEFLDESHWGWKQGYRYSCQDIEKRYGSFYVEENEIELISKYKIGETLWVREPARVFSSSDDVYMEYEYLADGLCDKIEYPERFTNPLSKWIAECQGIPNGCIKEMARIFLKVTDVRVELLQDITFGDIIKEGYPHEVLLHHKILEHKAITAENEHEKDILNWWTDLWSSTALKGYQWKDNPDVFVYEFERVEK